MVYDCVVIQSLMETPIDSEGDFMESDTSIDDLDEDDSHTIYFEYSAMLCPAALSDYQKMVGFVLHLQSTSCVTTLEKFNGLPQKSGNLCFFTGTSWPD